MILNHFREGKLGNITLDQIDMQNDELLKID
jgi:hypothetical protein